MELYLIDGSPRKKWNTATILERVSEGAQEENPDIKITLVNLYEYDYKGCISCFACKKIGGLSFGKCIVKDGIMPFLQPAIHADIIVFGSPIYFGDVTGMMRCFMERLLFPNYDYSPDHASIAPRKLHTGFVYTMNCTRKLMEEFHYPERLKSLEQFVGRIFGYPPLVQYVCDTYQFTDYGKYASAIFSPEKKLETREKQFPVDCEEARELGSRLVREAAS